jgi:hypothetical protein
MQANQEDLQSQRTWEFLGGDTGALWLLSEVQLRKQCKEADVDADGLGKDQMILRCVRGVALE